MEAQTIIIGLNAITTTSLGFFITMWIKAVNKQLAELVKGKLSGDAFIEYKEYAAELRELREKEIKFISDRLDSHGHVIACETCSGKATTRGIIL